MFYNGNILRDVEICHLPELGNWVNQSSNDQKALQLSAAAVDGADGDSATEMLV